MEHAPSLPEERGDSGKYPELEEVRKDKNIQIIANASLEKVEEGNRIKVRIKQKTSRIVADKCDDCHDCIRVCPVNLAEDGGILRTAVDFSTLNPGVYHILREEKPACQDTCPVQLDIRGFISLVSGGKFAEAIALIREETPFVGVLGYICTHPCEGECNRGTADAPLAIRALKRFLADWEKNRGEKPIVPARLPARKERVAVIGAGAVGMAVASELALAGHNITLYEMPQFHENIEPVIKSGGITLTRDGKTSFAKLHKATTDIAEAVKGAPTIMIATVSLAHQTIAELAAPYLEDGQKIIIFAGQMGSIEFKNVLNKKRPGLDVAVAETITAPYGTRREAVGKAEVVIRSPMKNLGLGAIPTKYTQDVMKTIEEFYPNWFFPATNIAEVGLNSLNTLAHPAPVLFMISQIERGDNYIYRAFTPSILKVVKASWDEKVAILRKLGLKDLYPYEDFVKLISDPGIRQLTGPSNMQHRFITEDCPMGMVALTSFGDLVGVPTPVCKSVISLFSAIVGRDFFKDGRNLKRLGLAGMSLDQLKKFLIEGSC